jgi:hypothetical protein
MIWIANIADNEFNWNYKRYITSREKYQELKEFMVKPFSPGKKSNSTGVNNAGKTTSDKQLGQAVINGTCLTNRLAVEVVRYYHSNSQFTCSQTE